MIKIKLEFDKVRSLLLFIEETVPLGSYAEYSSEVSSDDVYTLIKLHEAGYINATVRNFVSGETSVYVRGITWTGHQFLDNIRSPKAVEHSKGVIKTIGSASIQIMSQIAAAFIQKQLGL